MTYYGVWRVDKIKKVSKVVYENEENSYICKKTDNSLTFGTNSWTYFSCYLPEKMRSGFYDMDVTSKYGSPF